MHIKVNLTVGVDEAGKLHPLYLGTDGGEAKEAYTRAVNGEVEGIKHVQLFIRPNHDRRRDVEVAKPKVAAKKKAKRDE